MELARQFVQFGISLDCTISCIGICSNGTRVIEITNTDGKQYRIIERTQPGIEPHFTVIPHDTNVQTSLPKNRTSKNRTAKNRTSTPSSIKNHIQSCSWCGSPNHRLSYPRSSEAIRCGQVRIDKAHRIIDAISGKEISPMRSHQ